MKKLYFITWLIVGLGSWKTAQATHIFGGDFEMVYQSPGRYTITLNLFIDEKNASAGARTRISAPQLISIFRKRDNATMANVTLSPLPISAVQYDECGNSLGVATTKYSYVADVSLSGSVYNDSQGYYIAWQDCCRNNVVVNLNNSGNTGMTFFLEFPAVRDASGREFVNSSPKYTFPEGQIICANDLTKIDFSAVDNDNDQLQYFLVTPYATYSSTGGSNTVPPTAIRGTSYPPVTWRAGYDETNMIPGSPPLTIDPKTGIMTVKASERGAAFVVGVEVREYRNGVLIGSVRRDYQFQVTDCTPPPPPPTIFPANATKAQRDNGVKAVDFCEEGFIDLSTKDSTTYTFQWQKDGSNISGEHGPVLRVTAAGVYTVEVSTKGGCSRKSISEKTTVNAKPNEGVKIASSLPLPICEDKRNQLTLSVRNSASFTYVWFKNGDTLQTERKATLAVRESGKYSILVNSKVSTCTYLLDSNVVINPLPEAKITNPRNLTVICEDDTLHLSSSTGVGYIYEWRMNASVIPQGTTDKYDARKTGDYTIFITDKNKCTALSAVLRLTVNPSPIVSMDSLNPICGTAIPKVGLIGTPAGGKFEGTGVTGNDFYPGSTSYGRFRVIYTYTNQYQCFRKASRWIEVVQAPVVKLGPDKTITKGDVVPLKPLQAIASGATYQWTPPGGLSRADIANPNATPLATITYRLKVTYPNGCAAEDDILINVFPKLTIPTGFTPNGDGVNDSWEINGIADVPDCEVEVFNRWGEKVFFSKGYVSPFDGTRNGEKLPAATYYFVIKPNNGADDLKGVLTIIQ